MTVKEFERLNDRIDGINEDVTDGYYPTVSELTASHVDRHPENFIPLLLYFSGDPFGKLEKDEAENEDYKQLVSFSKRLLYSLNLADD